MKEDERTAEDERSPPQRGRILLALPSLPDPVTLRLLPPLGEFCGATQAPDQEDLSRGTGTGGNWRRKKSAGNLGLEFGIRMGKG